MAAALTVRSADIEMQLPIFQSDNTQFTLMQNKWASVLNPILNNAPIQMLFLQNIHLLSGVNTINHKLGRKPQGFYIVDIDAAATVYRSQPFNDLTLILTSNAAANVALVVF